MADITKADRQREERDEYVSAVLERIGAAYLEYTHGDYSRGRILDGNEHHAAKLVLIESWPLLDAPRIAERVKAILGAPAPERPE